MNSGHGFYYTTSQSEVQIQGIISVLHYHFLKPLLMNIWQCLCFVDGTMTELFKYYPSLPEDQSYASNPEISSFLSSCEYTVQVAQTVYTALWIIAINCKMSLPLDIPVFSMPFPPSLSSHQ